MGVEEGQAFRNQESLNQDHCKSERERERVNCGRKSRDIQTIKFQKILISSKLGNLGSGVDGDDVSRPFFLLVQ